MKEKIIKNGKNSIFCYLISVKTLYIAVDKIVQNLGIKSVDLCNFML